jgi:hypothetical protein
VRLYSAPLARLVDELADIRGKSAILDAEFLHPLDTAASWQTLR